MVAEGAGTKAIRVAEELLAAVWAAAKDHGGKERTATDKQKTKDAAKDLEHGGTLQVGDGTKRHEAEYGKDHADADHPADGSNPDEPGGRSGTV